jgi:outer membrane protein assembly factor BamB
VLNATNGHLVCKFAVTGTISSVPLVVDPDGHGRIVYFGDSGPGGGPDGGGMWAVSAVGNPGGPCHLKWRFDGFGNVPGSLTGQAGVYASPALGVDPSGRSLIVFGSTDPDNAVYALDARDGSRVWRFQTKITPDGDVGAAATISAPQVNGFADGVAYVVGKDGVAYALDLLTGDDIWATDLTRIEKKALNSGSGPALSGDQLYLGYGGDASASGGMFSLDAVNGTLNWDARSAAVISSPAVSGARGDKVILTADNSGVMRAYNASDGQVLWQMSTGVAIFSSFAISHGMAFIGGIDGNLYAFKT